MRWVGNWHTGQWTSACVEVRRNVSWATASSRCHVSRCSGGPVGSTHATRSLCLSLGARADLYVSFPRKYVRKKIVGRRWIDFTKSGKEPYCGTLHTDETAR